jgi:O-antigen ligase
MPRAGWFQETWPIANRAYQSRSLPLETSQPGTQMRSPQSLSRLGAFVMVAVLLPVWLPRPLQFGDLSLAFAVPFVLAFWALSQPAWHGSLARAVRGQSGRGLWLEMSCVAAIVVLATMSMFVSQEPLRAFRVILPMSYALCTLVLLTRIPPLLQRRFPHALLFSGVIALGVAILMAQAGSGRSMVMRDYRFLAFFENPNQLGIVILAVWPLAIALFLNARSVKARLVCLGMVLILATAIFMSGTKTALALGFVAGAVIWLYHASRSGSIDKMLFKLVIVGCAIVLAIPAVLWLLAWASPAFSKRVEEILTHGVWEFQSMKTRSAIWDESVRVGLAHPLLGGGAGTMVLNKAHSHNMVLDYFRGMGVFGMVAAVALIVCAAARVSSFIISTLHKGMTDRTSDTIVAGLYLGALFDLIANQLSDSFSPTTSFLFWMMYFGAYLMALPKTFTRRRVRRTSTLAWTPRARHVATPGTATQPL